MDKGLDQHISECNRCGTCCEKGGPSFHIEDKPLIETGKIKAKDIYTIRKDEPAYDNIRRALLPVASDVIKIKGKGESWCCRFYDQVESECRIYPNRPVECRLLKCWDTRAIESKYEKDRLTRKELLAEVEGLWDLVKSHEKRCSYGLIGQLVAELKHNRSKTVARQLIEIVEYDKQLRKLVAQDGRLDSEMLDFLFGRPLEKTIRAFGLKIEKTNGKTKLTSGSETGKDSLKLKAEGSKDERD